MKTNPLIQNNPNNNDIISRFQKFRQSFSGNPQQQVQQLLNSGRISQEQYNAAVQNAQTLAKLIGM
jgi:hypothetical protein